MLRSEHIRLMLPAAEAHHRVAAGGRVEHGPLERLERAEELRFGVDFMGQSGESKLFFSKIRRSTDAVRPAPVVRRRKECETMRRTWWSSGLPWVLAAAIVWTSVPASATGELPIAEMGDEWEALFLDQGVFIAPRVDVSLSTGVYYVLGYEMHAAGATEVQFVAYTGGNDIHDAFEALDGLLILGKGDYDTLGSYVTRYEKLADEAGLDLSKPGSWTRVDGQMASRTLSEVDLGAAGSVLLEKAQALPANEDLTIDGETICIVTNQVFNIQAGLNQTNQLEATKASAPALTESQISQTVFDTQAALVCLAWPPTSPPAFPPAAPPGWPGPPTGTPVYSGTPCTAAQVGTTSPCVTGSGQLCTCTCQAVGIIFSGASWHPNPGSCTTIPVTAVGTPCSPIGGIGRCTNASGKTCQCTCVAGPAGTGVWGSPTNCSGSGTVLALVLLALAGAGWRLRRRDRRPRTCPDPA